MSGTSDEAAAIVTEAVFVALWGGNTGVRLTDLPLKFGRVVRDTEATNAMIACCMVWWGVVAVECGCGGVWLIEARRGV